MEHCHKHHGVHAVVYRCIWCHKRWRRVVVGSVQDQLEQRIREVAAEFA
jgi:hypothetical protein